MKKLMLLILDGFGYNENSYGNAIKKANMGNFNDLFENYPHSILEASGEAVGLPDNVFGNSEVCHLTIGAGRKIKQDISICNETLGSSLIESNEKVLELVKHANENGGALHLMGLVSDGGVHSHIIYMKKLIGHLKNMGLKRLYFHVITDGRDTGIETSIQYIEELENVMKEIGLGKIATICGRFYAMDRDNRWERTKTYTDLVIDGKGAPIKNYHNGIKACYKNELTDEFLPPILLDDQGLIKDGDSYMWLNYRTDRARQIVNALFDSEFKEYRVKKLKDLKGLSLLPIPNTNGLPYLIEREDNAYSFGVYFSELGLHQARIAETEKYSHVTHFFNGGITKLKNCDCFLIPSPKVKTYDTSPEMSVREVTKQAIKCMEKDYDFILCNFCNPDILGHTGNMEACIQGLNVMDECIGKVIQAADNNFYKLIVVSDHGNCDEMIKPNGEVSTTHSLYPVPFVIRDKHVELKHKGDLTQIAPTILKYMDIAIPKDMEDTKLLFQENE